MTSDSVADARCHTTGNGATDTSTVAGNGGQRSATTIIVSSRDGAPVPEVKGALSLQRQAEAAGWCTRATYALAEVSTAYYATRPGVVKRPAYRLETVAVRLARGQERAYAVWKREDGGAWGFDSACPAPWRPLVGLRELIKRLKGEA